MEPKELKAYCPYANRDGFYHKSDVDKVLAEKDKQLCHSNHKRCVAMAKWCYDHWIRTYHMSKLQKTKFYLRWQKRWEELAEEPTWAKFLQLLHKEYKWAN